MVAQYRIDALSTPVGDLSLALFRVHHPILLDPFPWLSHFTRRGQLGLINISGIYVAILVVPMPTLAFKYAHVVFAAIRLVRNTVL